MLFGKRMTPIIGASVIQGQRGILHLRFRIKDFICSQCDRNYILLCQLKLSKK